MITWQGPGLRVARGRRGGGANSDPPPSATPGPPPAATFAMHLSDYKAVSGLLLPLTMTRSLNDQTLEEIHVKSYKLNPSFKGNTFTQPKP
jgi:hypothetical protein